MRREPDATVTDENGTVWKITVTREESSGRHIISGEREPVWSAHLKVDDHGSLFLSRYDDEPYWVADAHILANGFPVFSNGVGARVTSVRTLREGLLIDRLNQLIEGGQ